MRMKKRILFKKKQNRKKTAEKRILCKFALSLTISTEHWQSDKIVCCWNGKFGFDSHLSRTKEYKNWNSQLFRLMFSTEKDSVEPPACVCVADTWALGRWQLNLKTERSLRVTWQSTLGLSRWNYRYNFIPGSAAFSGSGLVNHTCQSRGYCSNDVIIPWKLVNLSNSVILSQHESASHCGQGLSICPSLSNT